MLEMRDSVGSTPGMPVPPVPPVPPLPRWLKLTLVAVFILLVVFFLVYANTAGASTSCGEPHV